MATKKKRAHTVGDALMALETDVSNSRRRAICILEECEELPVDEMFDVMDEMDKILDPEDF